MQTDKVTPFQFLVLVIFFTVGSSILYIPSTLTIAVKQDAWIAALIGNLLGLVVIWFFTTISLWFPKLTYIEINEKIFGKFLGKSISILFVLMTLLYASALIAQSSIFLITQMYPETPITFINLLLVIIVVMAVRLGIQTIARSAEIFIFIFFFLFIVLAVSISPQIDVTNLEPFFQTKLSSILSSSFKLTAVSTVNSIALFMIFPAFVNEIKKCRKNFYLGSLIGGAVIVSITMLCIFVLGSNTTARQVYPSYTLAKVINVGDFITRIEALMATLWTLALFFKVTLYFYAGVFGLSKILNIKEYRVLTFPVAAIVLFLSIIIFPNILYQTIFDEKNAIVITTIVGLFCPLLATIVFLLRKKKFKKDPDYANSN
ncbi:spore germination protein KB [Psychrobacillus psychrotolerans]|uniref:Spore germination protein KB n=1 Tax=Psychrobacillus psychrotolerans TaxID=126156 RepID=A0A1I5V9H8_9BACI|nr:endospore germination permease [Psychrobacillus psychrotolerans]SFQ04070.1 spore germination protein KB [Psychrobacillus psychrotolerans]